MERFADAGDRGLAFVSQDLHDGQLQLGQMMLFLHADFLDGSGRTADLWSSILCVWIYYRSRNSSRAIDRG
jgi:hypothetical protein